LVEVVNDALIEAVELGAPVLLEFSVAGDGLQQAVGEWCIDSLEELEEDKAERVTVRAQLTAVRA
jgi:hypothetical protein